MIRKAWNEISAEIIVNSLKHTGLLKDEKSNEIKTEEIKELQDGTKKLTHLEHPLTAIEYINATFEFMTHVKVIELAEKDQNFDSSEEESEQEDKEIRSEEAKDCIRKLRRYLEKMQ